MPPAPRDHSPGAHHVWVNATGREAYFIDDVDRMDWIRQLVGTLEFCGWRCLCFAQLTTHVHLLVDVPDLSLPLGMKRLNHRYSTDFNGRHGRHGQFVRRRYGNRRIVSAGDLVGAYAYLVLNPVAAGLVSRPEDWRWSSYTTTLGLTSDFSFVDPSLVLAELGGSVEALRTVVTSRCADLALSATAGV
ncbi:MAG TPA: hypothetical protein VJV76_03490 [Gaiellaceae bacterium]|nr:hypothetical protein [Gaiellaceae bacterium]